MFSPENIDYPARNGRHVLSGARQSIPSSNKSIGIVWPLEPQPMAARQIDLQCAGFAMVTWDNDIPRLVHLDR